MDPAACKVIAERYYTALDNDEYSVLRELLSTDFTQFRPDRTFEEKSAFIDFMQHNRPHNETTHAISGWYGSKQADPRSICAEGELKLADESTLFQFIDVLLLDADGKIQTISTYTR